MIILPLMKLPIIYGSNETNQNSEAPSDNSSRFQNTSNENNSEQSASPIETEIASFTTKIYTKDSDRQNNISITCSSLNDTTIENGQTFSFCNTVGKATSSKGYKKADVIVDKQVTQALGGGNCQVSSTLYNAILKVSDFKVTERHPHGKKVNYVPEGKDAAVSYGSKDLKFVNNTSNTIKIYASTDNKKVSIKIVSVK